MKKINLLFLLSFLFSTFIFISCEKEDDHDHIISNDGMQARMAYIKNGYTEIEVNPIIKLNCYFSDWNKDIMTPVSGLFEYYDIDGNWVASINFGDGTCDEWTTKTWNTNVFPDFPSGSENFSVFNYKDKK